MHFLCSRLSLFDVLRLESLYQFVSESSPNKCLVVVLSYFLRQLPGNLHLFLVDLVDPGRVRLLRIAHYNPFAISRQSVRLFCRLCTALKPFDFQQFQLHLVLNLGIEYLGDPQF